MLKEDSTLGFKLLAALGVFGFLALISLPIVIGYFALSGKIPMLSTTEKTVQQPIPTVKTPELGEEGSACGGPARLPCKPGLACSNDASVSESTGTCVIAPRR